MLSRWDCLKTTNLYGKKVINVSYSTLKSYILYIKTIDFIKKNMKIFIPPTCSVFPLGIKVMKLYEQRAIFSHCNSKAKYSFIKTKV